MNRFAVLCFVTLSYAKNINMPYLDGQDPDNLITGNIRSPDEDSKYDLWILSVKPEDGDSGVLRRARQEEMSEFNEYAEPLIEEYESRPQKPIRVKKDDPEKPYRKWKLSTDKNVKPAHEVKKDIFKLINKFDMHGKADILPDLDDDAACSVTLYFYGPYTTIAVQTGDKVYFNFITPPSPLADWFYDEHSSVSSEMETFVTIPEDVKKEFYPALLRLLEIILGGSL